MSSFPKRLLATCAALFILLSALALAGALEAQWSSFPTDNLVVHFSKGDVQPEWSEQIDPSSFYWMILNRRANELEDGFHGVENLLGVDYDQASQGAIHIFIYPELEQYQEDSGCLTCAAHVGGFLPALYDELIDRIKTGEVNQIAVYLTEDGTQSSVLHEFTHVLDFALIRNAPPTFLLEGLATYVGYRLDEAPDQWQLGLAEQFVKLYLEDYGIDLFEDYFLQGGYWKFTYNVGTSFLRFLAARGGWGKFLEFYAGLRRPADHEEVDRLFVKHYGAGLGELEAEWIRSLAAIRTTKNARAGYEFKLDQIPQRYIFLRPLLRDPKGAKRLFDEARTLQEGQFNEQGGAALRQYLDDPENLLPTRGAATRALEYSQYLLGYVRDYHRDERKLVGEFINAYTNQLPQLYREGKYEDFAQLYWELVHTYVTWR